MVFIKFTAKKSAEPRKTDLGLMGYRKILKEMIALLLKA
jgi:hypothetical protein